MKRCSDQRFRIIALFTALFLLPLFWPANNRSRSEYSFQPGSQASSRLSAPDRSNSPLLSNELTMPERSPHISSVHSSGDKYQPELLHHSSGGHTQLYISAILLYIIIWLHSISITSSQKTTIKYIHDQDGHKI